MSEYISKLNQPVYLTEEEFVEMRLQQQNWTIILPTLSIPFLDIVNNIYATTNLFYVIDYKKPLVPKVKILLALAEQNLVEYITLRPDQSFYTTMLNCVETDLRNIHD